MTIKEVKSSDRQEIAAAYEKVMPLVVEDWAHWLLSKPKTRRLSLIEQIAKHHGESVGQMAKDAPIRINKAKTHRAYALLILVTLCQPPLSTS